jgi:hypothetical protein
MAALGEGFTILTTFLNHLDLMKLDNFDFKGKD